MNVDVSVHEQRYKLLAKDMKVQFDLLLAEIRRLRGSNPNLKMQIDIIEKFLAEFEQYIQYPRIVQVNHDKIVEKIVEKDKIVQVARQD